MQQLEDTLLALESELGVMLTVHDVGGMFHDASGHPLLPPGRQSHRRNPLCVDFDRARCVAHCYHAVNLQAMAEPGAFTSCCWAGLVELVVPLRLDGVHCGTLAAGVWRPEAEEEPPPCHARVPALNEARRRLTPLPPSRAVTLGRTLTVTAKGLMAELGRLQRQGFEAAGRRGEILRFIATHAGDKVTTRNLAERLHLSSSRASHLMAELFGASFGELLSQERVNRAKTLLCCTTLRVKEVAQRSGFGDEFHFSKMFRRMVGVSPGVYRKSGTP